MDAIEPDASKTITEPESRWSKILRLGQENAETGFSGWLVIFTSFLCLLTGFNVWVLHSTDRTLYEQATARDRGWILVDLELSGATFQPFNPNDPIALRIFFRNVGHAAVAQLTYSYEVVKLARPVAKQSAAEPAAAEPVERRAETKGNAGVRDDEGNKQWEDVLRGIGFQSGKLSCTGHSLPTMLPIDYNIQNGTRQKVKDTEDDKLPKKRDL